VADTDIRPMTGATRADGAPLGLEEYRRSGGYEALRRALTELEPKDVTQLVIDSKLRGRGGAGFSTGRKWYYSPTGPDVPQPKYIACNADEMEPGCFKDRILMERNPHLLIEGMALGAYATQSNVAYLFLRGEYFGPAAAMRAAIAEAYEAHLLGDRILGTDFALELFVHMSAGRYLCGEASAMLNAIEGKRAIPRFRPPHMASAGLWAKPTIVNNVESFCCVPPIVRSGVQWWLDLARTDEGGTKMYTVAGKVKRPGWWELPMGTPMREVIEEHAGGMLHDSKLRAVIPGGASSSFVAAEDIDVPLDFTNLPKVGSRLGTATMVVVDNKACPVGLLRNLEMFFARESCGWCTPCWGSLPWIESLLDDIEGGRGRAGDLEMLNSLAWTIREEHCFCDHAPGASQPLTSGLRLFREDFEAHIREGRCTYR
jgi:NADH-quinone oxidoreductase subunit F